MIDTRLDLAVGILDLAVELAGRGAPTARFRGEDRIGIDLVAARAVDALGAAGAALRRLGGAWAAGAADIAVAEPFLANAVRAALQARDLIRDFVTAPNGAMTAGVDSAVTEATAEIDRAIDGLVWLIERCSADDPPGVGARVRRRAA